MDGLANVARQQQTQVESHVSEHTNVQHSQTQHTDIVKQMQDDSVKNDSKTLQKRDVESLVEQLNKSISPLNTDVKFGVDNDDIFYVSVIDTKTDKMIRRFPAEKGIEILPKMQEVTGILFDSKG